MRFLDLLRMVRDRDISRLRHLLAALAVERWGVGTAGFATEGGRRPEVVGRRVRHGAELRQQGPAFAEADDALDAALARETAALASSELAM